MSLKILPAASVIFTHKLLCVLPIKQLPTSHSVRSLLFNTTLLWFLGCMASWKQMMNNFTNIFHLIKFDVASLFVYLFKPDQWTNKASFHSNFLAYLQVTSSRSEIRCDSLRVKTTSLNDRNSMGQWSLKFVLSLTVDWLTRHSLVWFLWERTNFYFPEPSLRPLCLEITWLIDWSSKVDSQKW